MIKKIKHWVHTSKHKYINGPKGVISIMLAILMLPFFSLAAILVESERYQSAVSLLDSAMGSSSLSVLANYDNYVYNRFGVMSVSQDADIQKSFSQYLSYNTSHTSGSVALSNITAQGKYAISDPKVLKQQLLEYCKLNAPLTLADETLHLSELIKKLEGLTNITDIFSAINSAGKSVSSMKDVEDDIKELKEVISKLDTFRNDYDNKFNSFSKSVTDLASALAKPRPEYKASEEEYDAVKAAEVAAKAEAYDQNITKLRSAAEKAKSEYSANNASIESALNDYRNQMNKVIEHQSELSNNIISVGTSGVSGVSKLSSKALDGKIKDLKKQINNTTDKAQKAKLQEEMNEYVSQKSSNDTREVLSESTKEGAGEYLKKTKECFNDYNNNDVIKMIEAFHVQKDAVDSYSCSSITKDTNNPQPTIYHNAKITGIPDEKAVDVVISHLEEETISGSTVTLLKTLADMVKIEGVSDPKLSANINTGYYNTAIRDSNGTGGLPTKTNTGAQDYFTLVLTSYSNALKSETDVVKDVVTIKIFSIIPDLVKYFQAIGNYIINLIKLIGQLLERVDQLIKGNFDSLSLMTYFAYNLPNRTNFKDESASTMTGFKYKKIKYTEHEEDPQSYDLDQMIKTMKGFDSTGKDFTFCGAELEYIFFGSKSEVTNQMGSFFSVYFMRLMLDAGPVSSNGEVQAMEEVPYVGPILFLLELVGEPFMDTIILVNGGSVPGWATDIYLTPSGFPKLLEKIGGLKNESLKDKMKENGSNMKDAYDKCKLKDKIKDVGSDYKEDIFEFKYDAHMLAIMMLLGNEDAYVTRLADLIEMETYSYYKYENPYKVYNIYKAYTFIDSTADIKFNQLLPIPSLSTNILFQTKREIFRGY